MLWLLQGSTINPRQVSTCCSKQMSQGAEGNTQGSDWLLGVLREQLKHAASPLSNFIQCEACRCVAPAAQNTCHILLHILSLVSKPTVGEFSGLWLTPNFLRHTP